MPVSDRKRGLVWGLLGIAILSPDSLTLRLADFDLATVLAGRGLFTCLAVLMLAAIFGPRRLPTGSALAAALAYATTFCIGTITFVLSIRATHVANTLVIVSTAPLAAALLSALFLRDKLAWFTWLAAASAGLATLLVFAATAPVGFAASSTGHVYAAVNVLMLAAGVVIIRRFAAVNLVLGVAIGALAVGVIWLPKADFAALSAGQWLVIFCNGFVIQGFSFWLLTRAARLLSPPETSLLFLIELAVAPLLAWLFLNEQPQAQVLIAGALMMIVFVLHAWAATKFSQPET